MSENTRETKAIHALEPGVPLPTAGVHTLRVRYCECDPMGVAHHASYIPWLEIGRTELLRQGGISYAQLEAGGVLLVIVKLEVTYKLPAKYDDLLEVRTRVVGPGSRVKIRHEYEIVRARTPSASRDDSSEQLLLTGSTLLACVDRSGRPAALPDWLVTQH